MQPTAARSPSLNFFTPLPTLRDAPDDLVARHAGIPWACTLCHSSRTWCRSEWQTPQ